MERNPLVSIITPCYNGETYVHRFFDSVLQQTYPNMELIFVNDGSSDKTEEIALGYKDKLEKRGIRYTYIYQENAGQAMAINKALSLFKGEYLTWPDSDDWMAEDSIEKRVAYLEDHPEKGFVLCQTAVISETDLTHEIGRWKRENTASGWIFDDLIFERDILFHDYMVRSEMFLKALPDRQIYGSRAGQNWQMLLPIAYSHECGFIDEALYFCLIHSNSHSKTETRLEELIDRTYSHQDILEHVVQSICMPEEKRQHYMTQIEIKYIRQRLDYAILFGNKNALEQEYQKSRTKGIRNRTIDLTYRRGKSKGFDVLYRIMMSLFPRRLIEKVKKLL